MNAKVSVILPVYNVEKYLPKALNSLKKQTLKEAEFICVNDGSKDKSLEILKKYASEDPRFKIVDQVNQGSGKARNNGLKQAKGEFVAFLDPDDWFEKNTLEVLYNQAKKQACDMVVFGYKSIEEKTGKFLGKTNLKEKFQGIHELDTNKTFTWKDVKPKIFGGLSFASWNKFYKRDFLEKNNIHFTNCSLSEDNAFVLGSTLKANKIGYNDDIYYNYLHRKSSAVHQITDRNFCIFKVFDAVKKLIKECNLTQELSKEFDDYVTSTTMYHYKRIKSRDKFAQRCKEKLPQQKSIIEQEIKKQNIVFQKISEILATLK